MDKKKYRSPHCWTDELILEGIIAESNTELIDDGEEHYDTAQQKRKNGGFTREY